MNEDKHKAPTRKESDLIWWEALKTVCFAREGHYCGINKSLCKRERCYTLQVRGEK